MAEKKEIMEEERITFHARCDICHGDGKVTLRMEMPGVAKENLDIKIDEGRLIIRGNKKVGPADAEYRIREIRDGDYYHEFTIDDTIDPGKIDAEIKNGVVKLTLGIKEEVKPRKIEVVAK